LALPWLEEMRVTLIAEISSAEEFAARSREWFTGTLIEVLPGLYEGLQTRPAARLPTDVPGRSWGEPGQVLGILRMGLEGQVSGQRRTAYSDKAFRRFLDRLAEHPFSATIAITPLDAQGNQLHREWASARVTRDEVSPSWTSFEFSAPAVDTGWPESPDMQDKWAEFVKAHAARAGACAGGMADDAPFSLEIATGGWTWIKDTCQALRGYTWVTVVPGNLAARLGGAAALRASGAFCEVSPLPNGSLWLRATPAINDFTGDRIRRVFETLAPVLLTGVPRFDRNQRYRIIEGIDAASYQ
jgi:hypothetical protein